jgi:DNA-binding LytR/AlgR family response regulator
MMKAIAIDDEPIALSIIKSHASKVPFINLTATFTDAFEGMEYLQKESIDLIFLDIKMPDISGIEFLNSLRKKPLVIFTTAYTEHAVTSFELDAVDYLLKPFSLARFLKGCNKAFELFNYRNSSDPEDFLYLKTGYEQVKVFYEDILYLEATGNYVTFVLKDRNILSRSTFAEAANQLPVDKFTRIHRSYMVANNKIDKLEKNQVTIQKNVLPVSDAYSDQLISALKK